MYLKKAGGCIVTKTLLERKTQLKWLYREASTNEYDCGWRALGEEDTQEYIDNPENMKICDFKQLVELEPKVYNIYDMPVGSDLELVKDSSGTYFMDWKTGKEIREEVKSPFRIAFEKNLKFISRTSFDKEEISKLYRANMRLKWYTMGKCKMTTGKVIVADPLAYLKDTKYAYALDDEIPVGEYPIMLAILYSKMVGKRIACAKMKISNEEAVTYKLAQAKKEAELRNISIFSGLPVETGMGCFVDEEAAKDYRTFLEQWKQENLHQEIYRDYFKSLFEESYKVEPNYQRSGGDFLLWENPLTHSQIAFFATGLGDAYYPVLWGLDSEGKICELTTLFMNPEYF